MSSYINGLPTIFRVWVWVKADEGFYREMVFANPKAARLYGDHLVSKKECLTFDIVESLLRDEKTTADWIKEFA